MAISAFVRSPCALSSAALCHEPLLVHSFHRKERSRGKAGVGFAGERIQMRAALKKFDFRMHHAASWGRRLPALDSLLSPGPADSGGSSLGPWPGKVGAPPRGYSITPPNEVCEEVVATQEQKHRYLWHSPACRRARSRVGTMHTKFQHSAACKMHTSMHTMSVEALRML
jgi:hypothetical protein